MTEVAGVASVRPVEPPMSEPAVLRTADFDPKVKPYWMISTTMICVLTVVLIPILPFVWLLGHALIQRHLDRLSCTLTSRTLELRKGIFNRVQSTVPLEKITDLQMFQGPIMRHFGLHGFKVETAGQTNTAGSLLSIVGIVDAPAFRQAVLEQRDAQAGSEVPGAVTRTTSSGTPAAAADLSGTESLLRDIRDSLQRIEGRLQDGDR